ncbi:hypothetical protein DUI87_02727 [Hirundo rustica rustica]|uniref:Retroviral nucleocapsid Gag protein p24 C-terminal domain-containing protein n=1 Tax=Hirundo rustica rustica TaxID=333673 RepID=A0A3M0LA22_HIRRU|nr:hypothetical protein DUI87_02727 [Hirundo rustica rustica]
MLADREAKEAAKGEVPDKAVEAALIPDGKVSIKVTSLLEKVQRLLNVKDTTFLVFHLVTFLYMVYSFSKMSHTPLNTVGQQIEAREQGDKSVTQAAAKPDSEAKTTAVAAVKKGKKHTDKTDRPVVHVREHLCGDGEWVSALKQDQEIPLAVLECIKDAASKAFLSIQSDGPFQPYSKIKQLPSELFIKFVERLTRAIELQVKKERAQEEVLEEMALANANEQCKAAILSLPMEPAPTLDDMLQVPKIRTVSISHGLSLPPSQFDKK